MNFKPVNVKLFVVFSLLLISLYSCSTGDVSGTSETGNANMVGTVVTKEGTPVEGLVLALLPASYCVVEKGVPASEYFDTTNSKGEYQFNIEDEGAFVLSSVPTGDGRNALGILVSDIELSNQKVIHRNDMALTVHGMKLDTRKTPEQGRYYIRGTLLQSGAELEDGLALISSVPAVTLPSVYFYDTEMKSNIKVFNEKYITVSPDGDNIFNGFEEWPYWYRYLLPTDSGFMKIESDLNDFVLPISLENTMFRFDQALGNGQDLRFYSDHGKEVPYSLVEYDSAKAVAEIWLSLDALKANKDTSQHLTMVWGNPAAPLKDYSGEVYKKSGGYLSYWHCDSGTVLKDYSENAHVGTLQAVDFVEGVSGKCASFDGDGKQSYIEIATPDSLKATDGLTVVAWVRPTREGQDWESIFSYMADAGEEESGYSITYYNGQWRFMICTEVQSPNSIIYAPGTDQVKVGEWNQIVGTYDGAMIRFYLNGEEVATKVESGKIDWIYEPLSCRIGMYQGAQEMGYFNGLIDEVQILNRAVSADWVKVNYAALK